jgi:hypothetical protein
MAVCMGAWCGVGHNSQVACGGQLLCGGCGVNGQQPPQLLCGGCGVNGQQPPPQSRVQLNSLLEAPCVPVGLVSLVSLLE